MANLFAKLLLLAMMGVYVYLDVVTARARTAGRANAEAIMAGLLRPALPMTLALAGNALAVLQGVYAQHEYGSDPVTRSTLSLVFDQIGVLIGTAALMEVVRRALCIPLDAVHDPTLIGLRVQIAMYEDLLGRHLLVALGIGALFGVVSGPGLAAFLACELGIMWGGAVLLLRHLERKRTPRAARCSVESSPPSE